MPVVTIHFFQDEDKTVPLLNWLDELARNNITAYKKCLAYLRRLRD